MLEWFITFPGILITCGVLLLIISIVAFIVTTSKEEKKNEMPTEKANPELKVEEVKTEKEEVVEIPIEVEEKIIEIKTPDFNEKETKIDYSFEEEVPAQEIKTSAYGGYNPLDDIKFEKNNEEEIDILD